MAAGCPVAVAFRLFLASIMMGAWLSMYLCVKAVWGRETAVLASYLYAFSPILLADIFIRFAVGEALAFVFLPIVLYGFYRIVLEPKKPKTDWIWLSVGMSGLILFPYHINGAYGIDAGAVVPLFCPEDMGK